MGRLANLVDAVEAASKKIRAYHGSPHDFDRFSLDHIGTGEGAQMYGHGLYFADNIDVAKSYSPRDYDAEQLMLDRQARAMNNEDYLEAEFWDQAMLHKTPDEIMEFAGEYGDDEAIEAAQRVVDYMDSHGMRQNLMEVDINADPESLLDWDKPLSEQSQVIQDVARNLDISETGAMGKTAGVMRAYQEGRDVGVEATGQDLYRAVSDYGHLSEDGTRVLREAGIPGIRYLDGDSRAAGSGSSNYVIFDDSLIDIAKKYGTAGITAGGLGMGLLGSENAEAGPVSRAAREAAEHLDMSHAARMQRAREQGFDVDTPVYHGTDVDFDEFDPDRAIGTQFWSTTDRASVENGEVGAAGQGVIKEMYSNIQNPAGWEEYDKFGIGELIARGYDGVKLPDGNGGFTINAFSPNQYRSVNAAFDPAKKDSANLLAQAVPAGIGLGLLGMTPETAQADTGLSQRADAPDNPFLHTLGMGVGRFNRNLSRKGLGLLSLDGLEDYLMKGAYSPEDLNYGDRLKAALDVAP